MRYESSIHQSSAPSLGCSFCSLTYAAALAVVAWAGPALAFFPTPMTTDLVREVEGYPNPAGNVMPLRDGSRRLLFGRVELRGFEDRPYRGNGARGEYCQVSERFDSETDSRNGMCFMQHGKQVFKGLPCGTEPSGHRPCRCGVKSSLGGDCSCGFRRNQHPIVDNVTKPLRYFCVTKLGVSSV